MLVLNTTLGLPSGGTPLELGDGEIARGVRNVDGDVGT